MGYVVVVKSCMTPTTLPTWLHTPLEEKRENKEEKRKGKKEKNTVTQKGGYCQPFPFFSSDVIHLQQNITKYNKL